MRLFSWIKNNPVNRIVHFVKNSSVWLIFSAFLGLADGQAKKSRKNQQSYSAWPNLIARIPAVKARKKAIKNLSSTISSFPPQWVWLNALHGLVHLFLSNIKFYYLDIEGFSIYFIIIVTISVAQGHRFLIETTPMGRSPKKTK